MKVNIVHDCTLDRLANVIQRRKMKFYGNNDTPRKKTLFAEVKYIIEQ